MTHIQKDAKIKSLLKRRAKLHRKIAKIKRKLKRNEQVIGFFSHRQHCQCGLCLREWIATKKERPQCLTTKP